MNAIETHRLFQRERRPAQPVILDCPASFIDRGRIHRDHVTVSRPCVVLSGLVSTPATGFLIRWGRDKVNAGRTLGGSDDRQPRLRAARAHRIEDTCVPDGPSAGNLDYGALRLVPPLKYGRYWSVIGRWRREMRLRHSTGADRLNQRIAVRSILCWLINLCLAAERTEL